MLRFKLDEMQPRPLGHRVHRIIRHLPENQSIILIRLINYHVDVMLTTKLILLDSLLQEVVDWGHLYLQKPTGKQCSDKLTSGEDIPKTRRGGGTRRHTLDRRVGESGEREKRRTLENCDK